MAWVMAALPFVLLIAGFPVFLLLLLTSSAVVLFFSGTPAVVLHTTIANKLYTFPLLAVPFFIFAGEMMARGGISHRLIAWINAITGRMRGAMPVTSLTAATLFGAISGSTAATVAAIGGLTYKPMTDRGYEEKFSAALLTSAGAISNIIPPSVAMILYGFVTETSIVRLFLAGILPGLVMAAAFAGYIAFYLRRHRIEDGGEPFQFNAAMRATGRGLPALLMPVIVLGGIYLGWATPTEAGGIACVYAIVVSMLIYREVNAARLFEAATDSVYLTAQIFIIIAAAGIYSWLLTVTGVANDAVGFIASLELPPWMVLLIINCFLLLIGTVLDTPSAILILSPLLAKIAAAIGVDPIHFGIIVVMNLSIGTFTPPFGLNIFVGQAIFKLPLSKFYPGLVPFIAISIVVLMIVTYLPGLSLMLGGR